MRCGLIRARASGWVVRYPHALRRVRRRIGATLIEVALCTVIVGTGIAAAMEFMGSGTRVNKASAEQSLAIQIVRGAWEQTRLMPFPRLIALASKTKAERTTTVAGGYQWTIEVRKVDLSNLTSTAIAAPNTADEYVRLVFTAAHHGNNVYKTDWIVTKP